jgi:hypothetical protein
MNKNGIGFGLILPIITTMSKFHPNKSLKTASKVADKTYSSKKK